MSEDERGDFARFYADSRDMCLRAVTARTGDRTLAEDLVAESFARAWADWSKVSRHPAPQAWVVRSALNAHVSWWRKHRREVTVRSEGRSVAAPAEAVLDPALVDAVSQLPSRQREVFTLRVLLDLDTQTTARVLGIAPGTAMSHLSRAVASLRNTLQPPEDTSTRLEKFHE